MAKITVPARVIEVRREPTPQEMYHVTLHCQPYKEVRITRAPTFAVISSGNPSEGTVTLYVFGEPKVNVGDSVTVEIEPV
jgi:hypothetical protein